MSAPLSRLNDFTLNMGRVLISAPTVLAEGRPAGVHVSLISPHPKGKPHVVSKTVQGSSTVFIEGRPALYQGVRTTCGHPLITGCGTVFVGR